jgi:hypothetical protein
MKNKIEWDLEIGNASHCIRGSEAIVSVAVVLRDACIKAPHSIGRTWIYWDGKGSLRARRESGTVFFSWETDVTSVRFAGIAEAVLEVSKIVGRRKTRSKRARKDGV